MSSFASSGESAFEEKLVSLNRVQKVHKGGRTLRWNALVVVGDRAGSVGVGLGKSDFRCCRPLGELIGVV